MTFPSPESRRASAMPSRTSLLVAAARVFGSREPDESLRNPDLLADQLIGPAELALISGHPLSQMREREYADAAQDPAIVFFVSLVGRVDGRLLNRCGFIPGEGHRNFAIARGVSHRPVTIVVRV
jgi:hypothetical protein